MKKNLIEILKNIKNIILTNKKITMEILAGIIIIVTILVIASCFKTNKFENSTGNNNNLGLATQAGNKIFYVDIDDGEIVGICKMNKNGKKTEKISEGMLSNINVMGNYIYCIESENSEKNLIRIKTNGDKREILARDIERGAITVTEKWIYYYKNNNLYRAKLDGTDKEKISEKDILYYQIEGNWIYYIYKNDSSKYIARMKLNGTKAERIAKAEDTEDFETLYIKNGKIYYISAILEENYDYTYYLYKINKNGNKKERICKIDTNVQYINMQEKNIYYTTTTDYNTYTIKSIKYNGTDKTTIKKTGELTGINITEDWIIYLGTNDDNDNVLKMIEHNGDKEKDL